MKKTVRSVEDESSDAVVGGELGRMSECVCGRKEEEERRGGQEFL